MQNSVDGSRAEGSETSTESDSGSPGVSPDAEGLGSKEQDFMRCGGTSEYYGQQIEGEKEAARKARTAEHAGSRVGYDEDGYGSHPKPQAPQLAA